MSPVRASQSELLGFITMARCSASPSMIPMLDDVFTP
jgi:hypothetical protein